MVTAKQIIEETTTDDTLARIDLRRLFPNLHGNPVHVHCCINPQHKDTGKPNMAVNPQYVYCFRCHQYKGAYDFIALYKGWYTSDGRPNRKAAREWATNPANGLLSDAEQEKRGIEVAPLNLSDVEIWHASLFDKQLDRAQWFAGHYGIPLAVQRRMKLGHTGYAFTLPIYTGDGELINVRRRTDEGRVPNPKVRYWGEPGHNQPAWYLAPAINMGFPLPSWDRVLEYSAWPDLLITEGEFDAAALCSVGIAAISATDGGGALLGRHRDLLRPFADMTVGLAFDQDAAGLEYAQGVAELLRGYGADVYIVRWPLRCGKDASAAVAAGATEENFLRALNYAKQGGTNGYAGQEALYAGRGRYVEGHPPAQSAQTTGFAA